MASLELYFECVFKVTNPLIDVVFVHGLTGDPHSTWTWDGGNESWFPALGHDLNWANIWSVGYPVSLFEKIAKKEMNIYDRSGNVLEQMAAKGIGARPIVFVAHSLGGLLVKQIILRSKDAEDNARRSVSEAVRKVVFLATPHSGAVLASVLKFAFPRLKSQHIELLSGDSGELSSLADRYRSFANTSEIKTIAYFENFKTKGMSLVVSKSSADPGVAGCEVVGLDKDHINISKPRNRNDQLYEAVRFRIQQEVDLIGGGTAMNGTGAFLEDYQKRCELDRRTLLEKLIDAGMESDYEHANDSQLKFSMLYKKFGLFDPARSNFDEILSEVETRFLNKIYRPLIQCDVDKSQVYSAVQDEVIEYVKEKLSTKRMVDTKLVYSAMYYLTEQCYIKWDKS
ncbi:ABC-three component system protein [Thalassospira lucentensis]|uniref:ABC-three component system protein n=1 Tax=Thalassospira lucentensis TaxID=168935 RepID=UPI003D2F35A8